jgi:hypothetical protein
MTETTEERLRREYEQILCKPPATQDFTSNDQWRERVDAAYAALRAEIQRPLNKIIDDAIEEVESLLIGDRDGVLRRLYDILNPTLHPEDGGAS